MPVAGDIYVRGCDDWDYAKIITFSTHQYDASIEEACLLVASRLSRWCESEAAARLESERKKARLPVPARKAKYLVDKIVGKAKQGKARKVFWKEEDSGALCSTAACTWTPPTDFDGDSGKLIPKEILGKSITIEEQGVIYEATVAADKVRAVQPTSFFVTYTKNVTTGKPSRKKARWVDFELPAAEKTSWWRLAGYGTESSASSESSDNEESKGAGSESEMEIDD